MPQETSGDPEVWLSPKQASPIIGFAEQTLANWRSLRIGPPYEKVGEGKAARVRYARSELLAWMRGRRAGAA